MTKQGQLLWWKISIAAVAILVLIAGGLILLRPGIDTNIQNSGEKKIASVVLYVTGNSYSLGDLGPGSSRKVTINPISESHLEIEFIDVDGKLQRLDAGGYFEPNYRGTIRVAIKDGVVVRNVQQINSY